MLSANCLNDVKTSQDGGCPPTQDSWHQGFGEAAQFSKLSLELADRRRDMRASQWPALGAVLPKRLRSFPQQRGQEDDGSRCQLITRGFSMPFPEP